MMNIFNLLHNNKDTNENGAHIGYKNTVTIVGKIVHKFATDKVTILTVGVYANKPNFPKVLFFGDNCKKSAQFNTGDMVRIEGNIQSSKVEPGKNLKSISIFGDNIDRFDSALGYYDISSNINRIEIAGTVVDMIDWNHILKLRIRTFKNNRMSIVPVDYYYYSTNELSNIKVGDTVSLIGTVQTRKKLLNSETVYFENYVARKIVIETTSCDELETA